MNKQMMSMEELEQVNGGNIFTDAWDWVCEKVKDCTPRIVPFPDYLKPSPPVLPPIYDIPFD